MDKVIVKIGNKFANNISVTLEKYSSKGTISTDKKGQVIFKNVETGTHTIKIETSEKDKLSKQTIYATVFVKNKKTVTKNIKLISSETDFDWDEYDHYKYEQKHGKTLDKHILFEKDGIRMQGYTEVPFKDFLLTKNIDEDDKEDSLNQKLLYFDIKRDQNDWHTMEGGGFLFNIKVEDKNISGYCVIITQKGIMLYEINDVNAKKFSDGKIGNISDLGKLLYNVKIRNVLGDHSLSMRATNNNVTLWCDGTIVIDNLKLPNEYGQEFGPITSHKKHDCNQTSYFYFSNIRMDSVSENQK